LKKKWSHNITVAQFRHLPVDWIGTAAVEHKARAAQHINLKVWALFGGEGLGVVVSALAALILILALQPNVTHHNLHALLALGLGMGTLNLNSAEIEKLIFFQSSNTN
jgi:threonine/homoserine efflux transporter RhtA